MPIQRETIQLAAEQSFRLIRWTHSVDQVDSLLADGSQQALEGEGNHWHYHPEMELTLFIAGQGNRFIGDHIGQFSAGDLVLLGSRLPHHWDAAGPTAGLSLQWIFPPYHPLWSLPESRCLPPLFERAAAGLKLSGQTQQHITAEIHALTAARGLARFARLLELLALIAEAPPAEASALASDSFIPPIDTTYQDAMSRVVRHMLENFRDPVRLDAMHEIARMSRPTFARQFKRHTGRSLTDFLVKLRLQDACHELLTTSKSVLEIALGCGFSHVSFFNRTFRLAFGCNPTAYKTKLRHNPLSRRK
jgi:AraC-like DNA-binding protein